MAYPQHNNACHRGVPGYTTFFNQASFPHSPAESIVGLNYRHPQAGSPSMAALPGSMPAMYQSRLIGHSDQQLSYPTVQQPHYDSPSASRRPSYAGPGHGVNPSLSPSTPNASWNSLPANSGTYSVSPSIGKWSNSSHTSYFRSDSIAASPSKAEAGPHLNAAAPSFTPHSSTSTHRNATIVHEADCAGSTLLPAGSASPVDKQWPVPRLHRTAPSISLSTLNRPVPPPSRSPLRGVSPVGSSFSNADCAPLLNSFGLPINKPRIYKVLLPLEADELRFEETRKHSIWKRKPLSIDIDSLQDVVEADVKMLVEFRSKSPHPEEQDGDIPLPDTLEVYLPNDWQMLRQAIFEERMAKIGITRDYLRNMSSLLPKTIEIQKSYTSPAKQSGAMTRPHLRSESVFAAPFVPRWANSLQSETAEQKPSSSRTTFERGHSTAMSVAVPSFAPFKRNQPPFGPRDLPLSRNLTAFGLVAAVEEEEEEEEAEDGVKAEKETGLKREDESKMEALLAKNDTQPHPVVENTSTHVMVSKSAKEMTLEELSAGFGFDADPVAGSAQQLSEMTEWRPPSRSIPSSPVHAVHERMAVEGVVGHCSLPTSASLDHSMIEDATRLSAPHQPRKSVSAPDLHERLSEEVKAFPHPTQSRAEDIAVDHGDGSQSDLESAAGTEYSNPSDEERAKARRNRGLPPGHISAKWCDGLNNAAVVSDSSNEGAPAPKRPSWLLEHQHDGMAHSNVSMPGHAQQPSQASSCLFALQKRPSSLNANAPPFVLGVKLNVGDQKNGSTNSSFSYSRDTHFEQHTDSSSSARSLLHEDPSTIRYAESQLRLNVEAPEFKPMDLVPAAEEQDAIPQTLTGSSTPLSWGDRSAFVHTLGEAKSVVDNWLTDVTSLDERDQHRSHDDLNFRASVTDVLPTEPKSNMQTFRFPPSSPNQDLWKSEQKSKATPSPQLPSFGTIGRNTFRNALRGLSFNKAGTDEDFFMPATPRDACFSGHRSPIPAFGPTMVKEEMRTPPSLPVSGPCLPPESMPAVLGSRLSEVSTGQVKVKTESDEEADFSRATPLDRPAHRDGSPGHPRVKSTSSSVPSSVAQAIRAAHLPDESLHQTWKFFESILDKKLDGFRESVASVQNSPPSQTWSPDAKAILASTIREAIRDEMPRSRFDSATTNDTDATKEQALLVAIQQTQNMINALTRHHDDPGLETASPSGEWKESSVQSAQNARSDNDAFIEQLAERLAQRTGKLDIKYIVEKLSQVYHNSLQEAIAKMENRQAIQETTLAERFNTFVETYQKGPSSVRANDVDLVQDVQEAILACVPAFVHAMTPILTVLPNSPTSEQRNAMQQLSNSPEGSNMLAELAALREAIQSDMVKRIDMSMLQQELAVKNTECEQAKAELLRHSEDFDIERTRFRDEMNEARHKLAIKDKQLDALRDELLKRATVMDDEARETQRSHATIVSNLEASLSELKSQVISMEEIVKAQTVTGDSLRAQLVEAKERLATAEKERQAQAALIAEQQTSYQALHALMVKRQIEHDIYMSKMQDILGHEAAHRVKLEDRVTASQKEAAKARGRLVKAQDELSLSKTSTIALRARAKQAKTINRQLSGLLRDVSARIEEHSVSAQKMNENLANVASQTNEAQLFWLFAQVPDVLPSKGLAGTTFETVFPDSRLPATNSSMQAGLVSECTGVGPFSLSTATQGPGGWWSKSTPHM